MKTPDRDQTSGRVPTTPTTGPHLCQSKPPLDYKHQRANRPQPSKSSDLVWSAVAVLLGCIEPFLRLLQQCQDGLGIARADERRQISVDRLQARPFDNKITTTNIQTSGVRTQLSLIFPCIYHA